jgi:hypothetical protein
VLDHAISLTETALVSSQSCDSCPTAARTLNFVYVFLIVGVLLFGTNDASPVAIAAEYTVEAGQSLREPFLGFPYILVPVVAYGLEERVSINPLMRL